MKTILLGSVVLIAGFGMASAQLPTQKVLTAKLAMEAVTATVEACEKAGYKVSASVVDVAGQVKAFLRGDGSGFHTIETATRKALTSVTFKGSSAAIAQRFNDNPASGGLRQVTGVMPVGGALPIMVGNDIIGAIGVSGAPGGDKDEACSQAGIDKIKDSLK
ncbi:MAG: heme-binding protein [Rhodospirillales bacterium]